jgi:hypothetical protein
MKKSKKFSAVIGLLLIAFFTTSWVSLTQAQKPTTVLITVPFHFTVATPPTYTYEGIFTISGAFAATGNAIMEATVNVNFKVYHCIWTLTDGNGTITIHEQCQLGSTPIKGRWEIVSGTGDYANLRGNGSALMPAAYEGVPAQAWEILTGVIY